MQAFIKKFLISFMLSTAAMMGAQSPSSTQIDPATRINWPRITGAGTPTSLGIACASTNYGQPFLDTATTPNTPYTCGTNGWALGSVGSISSSTSTTLTGLLEGAGGNVGVATAGTTCPDGEAAGGVDALLNAINCIEPGTIDGITSSDSGAIVNIPGTLNTGPQTINASGVNVQADTITTKFLGFGWSYGNDGSSAEGWSSGSGIDQVFYSASNGIHQAYSYENTADNLGDGMGFYGYSQYFGDGYGASNEGVGGATLQTYQIGFYTGTLEGAGTGGASGSPYGLNDVGVTYVAGAFTTSGNVQTITVNWLSGHPPAVGQVVTIIFQTRIAQTSSGATLTSPVIFNLTATSTALSQTFTSGVDYSPVSAIQGQYLAVYVASGVPTANVQEGCYYNSGPPTAGATFYANCTDAGGLEPAVSATVTSGSTTGSTLLSTSDFSCNGYCNARAGQNFAQGGILLDATQVIGSYSTTGQLTQVSGLAPYYTITTGSVTPSTAWGTIIPTSCTPNSNGQSITQVATTCNVTLGTSPASPGPFAAGTNVHVYRENVQEESPVTAVGSVTGGIQSVTFLTANAWNTTTYGPAPVMMQGGPGSVAVVPTAYASSWPIPNMVVGAYTSNEIAVSTAQGELQFPTYCAPITYTLGATPVYPNATLVRTGNVVTLSNWQSLDKCLATGSSLTISGATPSDLNGTFTVTYNSYDTYNAYVTWAQTGSNETATGSVTVTTPLNSLTLYPAAYIVGNNGGVEGSAQLSANTVPWAPGDDVVGAPNPVYRQTGLWLDMGQSSPNDNSSVGLFITDSSGSTGGSMTDAIVVDAYASDAAFYIRGSTPTDFKLDNRPRNNGAIIYEAGGEPISSNAKEYIIYEDNNSGGTSGTDAGVFTFNPNGGVFGFSGPITSAAGTSAFSALTVGGASVCTYNGTNAVNCPPLHNTVSLSIASSTQAANSCNAITSFTLSGVTTSSPNNLLGYNYTAAQSSLNGWGAYGGIVLHLWPSAANTVAGEICNQSASPITYSANTFTVGVI